MSIYGELWVSVQAMEARYKGPGKSSDPSSAVHTRTPVGTSRFVTLLMQTRYRLATCFRLLTHPPECDYYL